MFRALDDRCQSGDEKTKFGAKIANDMATVDWLKVDISEHMCSGTTFLSGQNPYKTLLVYIIKAFFACYFSLKSTEILTSHEN